MAKVVNFERAHLNTASISVRTLQIEGKQVTLAVFRQILDEDIVGETDGEMYLKGVGWGHVNYLLTERGSINLVWQKGTELRRCVVARRRIWPFSYDPPSAISRRYLEQYTAAKEEALAEHQLLVTRSERYNQVVAPLFDLPQLFIAV